MSKDNVPFLAFVFGVIVSSISHAFFAFPAFSDEGAKAALTASSPCSKEDTRQLTVGSETWACVAGEWRVVE